MHLEGRSDSTVSITEEEYEMLLMYKMQVELLNMKAKDEEQ